jgi:hypothetical protein
MSSTGDREPTLFSSLTDPASPEASPVDRGLDLRISAWMRRSQFDFDEAQQMMGALRTAILEAAQMDADSEPIPLTGRSAEADLLSWAAYLTSLIERAESIGRWDSELVLESAIRHLAA